MYHFEFMDGRAIIEGLRQGAPQSKVVGMQHGPITPMKMLYSGTPDERHRTPSGSPPMPEPDLYAVDGVWPAAVLERRGIPRSRISVPGAVRFDDVWDESRRLQRARRVGGMVRVLVAPGLHDTAFVVGLALTALKGDPRVELVLKPHPRVSPQSVARWIGPEGGSDSGLSGQARVTLVKSGSIYEWMAQCDIFLATYSSTAVEALAFGIPVILLVPDHSPDMSMYKGHHAPVLRASNAREIREHIDRLASDSTATAEYIARISPALEDCFGPTDCQAAQRLAELCIQLAAERAPQPVPKSDAVRQVV